MTRAHFPLPLAVLALATPLSMCGCGPDNDPEPEPLNVIVQDPDGQRIDAFQLTVTTPSGSHAAYCSTETQEHGEEVSCTEAGALVHAPASTLTLTAKSPGFATLTEELETPEGEAPELSLTLTPLPAFESTEDYATGFAADGMEAFLDMGVALPTESGNTVVVKFFIGELAGEPQVYFQNTRRHPLHYGFVSSVLDWAGSLSDYESSTYQGEDRAQMAGSIIFYPDRVVDSAVLGGEAQSPVTVEFFPSDNLSPALALRAHRLIEERLLFCPLFGGEHRLFYMPASESRDSELRDQTGAFAAAGALWLGREELYGNLSHQLLNEGVGYGTLRVMSPEDLETSPVSYQDIVVLTRLPNEAPLVGGTITEELQTPLAHVNVAARARGTPNMSLLQASEDERIAPLVGELVRFEVTRQGFTLELATQEDALAFWEGLIPEEQTVPDFDIERTGLLAFADLAFADSIAVGVKAANLAELSQLLPETAPDGFAVPFYYFDQFMNAPREESGLCVQAEADCIDEGRDTSLCAEALTLCQSWEGQGQSLFGYVDMLLENGRFSTDTVYREAVLDGLRYLIHHIPVDETFGQQLDAMVEQRHGEGRVRLRSSTNAEDLPSFSGAGLYRSISAEIGGTRAPSLRIRKVWASAYNFRAFEERTYWNIDHTAVRVGVAVHRSFPDEQANGVLITRNLADPAVDGYYVNVQEGEHSVTNPEDGALPEIFTILPYGGGSEIVRQRFSSLRPDHPLMTIEEIQALYQAARAIQSHFAALYGEDPYSFALDMEFKLHGPERILVIKQVRPYFDR